MNRKLFWLLAAAVAWFGCDGARGQSGLIATNPCRALDTRIAGVPLAAKSTTVLSFAMCSPPANATAYNLNVTAIPVGKLGYAVLWPTGQPQPTASTLNVQGPYAQANFLTVAAGTNETVSLYVTDATQIAVDVYGWYVPIATGGTVFPSIAAAVNSTGAISFSSSALPPQLQQPAGFTLPSTLPPGSPVYLGIVPGYGVPSLLHLGCPVCAWYSLSISCGTNCVFDQAVGPQPYSGELPIATCQTGAWTCTSMWLYPPPI